MSPPPGRLSNIAADVSSSNCHVLNPTSPGTILSVSLQSGKFSGYIIILLYFRNLIISLDDLLFMNCNVLPDVLSELSDGRDLVSPSLTVVHFSLT